MPKSIIEQLKEPPEYKYKVLVQDHPKDLICAIESIDKEYIIKYRDTTIKQGGKAMAQELINNKWEIIK
jgi:hypothetical protein